MRGFILMFVFVFVCNEAMGLPQPVTESAVGAIWRSTTSADQRECIWKCPKTRDYDPVCGTDGEWYYNMDYLKCARNCGIDVLYDHPVPCGDDKTTTTTTHFPLPPTYDWRR